MKVYQTNFLRLAVLLLPTILRQPAIIAFLRTLVTPIVLLQNKFDDFCENVSFQLHHNGQVCYLKDALNKRFLLSYTDGFEIQDINTQGEWLMAYDEDDIVHSDEHIIIEDEPEYLMIWNENVINISTTSFIVFVPAHLYGNENEDNDNRRVIRTLVEQYRLVSRIPIYQQKN